MSGSQYAALNQSSNAKKRERVIINIKNIDYTILLVVILLTFIGIVMVFSASYLQIKNDAFFYLKKQIIYAIAGFMCLTIMTSFYYNHLKKFTMLIYFVTNILLIAVQIMGEEAGGATRWIKIFGIQFQPSELSKIAIILLISHIISSNKKILHEWRGFLFCCAAVLITSILVFLGGLSNALIVTVIGFSIIFIASPHILRFVVAIVSGLGAAVILFFMFMGSGNFRYARISVWLDPFSDKTGIAYQVINSLYAIASGGLFGLGIGTSRQKTFIPEVHNDIIFSIISEELGFLGVVIVLLLFAILIWRGIKIAMNAPDDFASLVATGIVVKIAAQVIINVAVVTNSIPNTGVTIPFISSGGTSLVVSLFLIGILLNISRYSRSV